MYTDKRKNVNDCHFFYFFFTIFGQCRVLKSIRANFLCHCDISICKTAHRIIKKMANFVEGHLHIVQNEWDLPKISPIFL